MIMALAENKRTLHRCTLKMYGLLLDCTERDLFDDLYNIRMCMAISVSYGFFGGR